MNQPFNPSYCNIFSLTFVTCDVSSSVIGNLETKRWTHKAALNEWRGKIEENVTQEKEEEEERQIYMRVECTYQVQYGISVLEN